MNEIGEKYLPIGTIVLLKEATKRVMIIGFCSVDATNKEKLWDYGGCLYPEGFLGAQYSCLFNHDQIDKVFFTGFVDDEEKEFKSNLSDLLKSRQLSK